MIGDRSARGDEIGQPPRVVDHPRPRLCQHTPAART